MKLYVGNLSFNTTEQGLEAMFAEHGAVQSTAIVMDRETGRSRGFGFIEMSDDVGRTAMAALNGQSVDGRDLTVNEARPRGEGGGGRGGRSEGTSDRAGW
jgi:RNA recognition motif-containing protein